VGNSDPFVELVAGCRKFGMNALRARIRPELL
jgi:hypothetical protein